VTIEKITLLQILAILSASAAGGMRIGLPLLIVGIARLDQLWTNIPFLSNINPQIIVGVLTSWTLFELFGTKKLIGLRIVQIVQLLFSPFVGAFMAIAVSALIDVKITPLWLLGLTGGLLALVLKLVLVGWFFRWGKMPIILIFLEDFLSAILVFFALESPENGGLIAMILLWLALRSSNEWKYRFKIKSDLETKTK
jgi:hypothetical protein